MKIITALDNPKIIKKLKNENYELIGKDIQYREAIIEIVEKIKNIDLIIINEKIPGEINIRDLIKQINIINKKIQKEINKKDKIKQIKKINKKIKIIILLKNISQIKNINNKNVIFLSEEKFKVEKISILINKKDVKNNNLSNKKNIKIINIFGNKQVGKTTISILLANYLINKNKKVLLINLNEKNNKKIKKNYLKILEENFLNKKILKNLDIKINKNSKLIKNLKINLIKNKIIDKKQIKNFLNNLILYYKNKYDYIIFDIEFVKYNNWNTEILKISTDNIGVIERNLIGIKGIKRFYDRSENNYLLKKSGLHIIENKYNILSIHSKIINDILDNFFKIYKIKKRKNYKFIIEKFKLNEKIKLDKKIEKIFSKIINE